MRINQNISAVIVNDQLLRNENSLSESVRRLSSGFKFNSAKDNPSGVAISYKMQAQIDALSRASSNTTDGISIVQTIDSAMGEIGDIIQRISELCVQAANGTNSLNDRKAIQKEVDSLKEEIDRISSDTEFNGKVLLDGSLDRRTYVTTTMGRIDGKTASAYDKIDNVIISDSVQSGHYHITVTQNETHAVLRTYRPMFGIIQNDGWVEVNGIVAEIKQGMSAKDVYWAIQNAGEAAGVNVFVYDANAYNSDVVNGYANVQDLNDETLKSQGILVDYANDSNFNSEYGLVFVSEEFGSEAKVAISCSNGELRDLLSFDDMHTLERDETYACIPPVRQEDGTYMITQYGRDLKVKINNEEFSEQTVVKTDGGQVKIMDRGGFEIDFEVNKVVEEGYVFDIEATDIGTLQLQVGANQDQELNVRVPEITTKTLFMADLDVTKDGGSERGIDQTDTALTILSAARSKMGAYQNSLEFSQKSLDATIEDMTTAISRLGDTDMAEEMTTYTNANVLTQASISVLSQANDLPQQVLSLLQG